MKSNQSQPHRVVFYNDPKVDKNEHSFLGQNLNVSKNEKTFINTRLELFEKLYLKQQEENNKKSKEIEICFENNAYKCQIFKTCPLDILKKQSKAFASNIIIAKVEPSCLEDLNNTICANVENPDDTCCCSSSLLWDLTRPFEFSCTVKFLSFDDDDAKSVFWHSSAHILGAALEECYGAHLTIGPPLERGFYYDAYLGELKLSQENYTEVETAAKSLIKNAAPFQRLVVTKAEALQLFKSNPFKVQLITTKVPDGGLTSVYRCGPLVDLCRGPHVISTGSIGAFMIEKHSSSYWLGNAKNDSLQRMYGISFPTAKQLKEYQELVEKMKTSDHRLIGKQLNFFFFDTQMSPGSCFFLPHGAKIYNRLEQFIRSEYRFRGFSEVMSPNIFSSDLFQISGHWQNYKENMYCFDVEEKQWALKPMNCPGHCLMFTYMRPSYKQLPIRLADFGVLHRNEASGSLTGLIRVRRFQQDDAHIFCRPDQIQEEVRSSLEFLFHVYDVFNFNFDIKLSTRPLKALGSVELWKKAESALADAITATGKPWKINPGDGAFYGPKIDIRIQDALQRWHQCGTIQLDFQLPLRFNLMYRTEQITSKSDNIHSNKEIDVSSENVVNTEKKEENHSLEEPLKPGYERPVMIHRAILGSIERMLAVLLEHTSGKLPFWLSPRQALICPINSKINNYAQQVCDILRKNGFEVEVEETNATINKKIRQAQLERWCFVLVVGAQEEEKQTVMLRDCSNPKSQKELNIEEVLNLFKVYNVPGYKASM